MNKWVIERAVTGRPDRDDPALPDAVDSTCRLVLFALLSLAQSDGDILPDDEPSQGDLANMTGVDKATVKRALNRLEGAGWVVRHRPDPIKARTEYAKTRYELRHPTLGAQCAPPRRTEHLDLGAQCAPVGPDSRRTVRHLPLPEELLLPTDLFSVRTDQAPTSGAPTPEDDDVSTDPPGAKGARTKTDRGSRLPQDWEPAVEMKHWTITEGLTPDEARREVDRFRDYWHSLSGARAVKKNWDATWRNWVRKAVDDKNRAKVRQFTRPDKTEQVLADAEARLGITNPFATPPADARQAQFPFLVIDGETA